MRYRRKVTGYFREQVFRLIRQYGKTGRLDLRLRSQGRKFTQRYTASDLGLLAVMGERRKAQPPDRPGYSSEYVHKRGAKPLEKLRIEFAKSPPRRSKDNALVEGKNVRQPRA